MILGITGGTGTGKTDACEYFRQRGFLVIDSDKVSRRISAKGSPCLREIVSEFGEGILDWEGELARKVLGRIVFADARKLQKLNEITHKYIIEDIKSIISANKDRNIVLDAPLLLETKLDRICTDTLCILADKDTRTARIMARDCISREDAQNRIASQKDDEYYISRCDKVVRNDTDKESLVRMLDEIYGGTDGKE